MTDEFTGFVSANLGDDQLKRAGNRMRYYRIIQEADGTFSVYVTEAGTLPGRYSGFKSEADATMPDF